MNTSRFAKLSLFGVLALALYGLESLLPPLFPIPGIKLGLSNLVTVLLLYDHKKHSFCDPLWVLVVRILLASILFGQVVSLFYSLIGGLFCFASMTAVCKLLHGHYPIIGSMVGGLTHNIGQLCVAMLLTVSFAPLAFLPYLLISGLFAGFGIGLLAVLLGRSVLHTLPRSS
ncbi:MAG: Gx transporter family protein [Lachnospiraceae bacterium]|jgi:heptaprenyl diphosphate synthase|nr:Gx transporter family protein [Lachnospiraceae bacterium]